VVALVTFDGEVWILLILHWNSQKATGGIVVTSRYIGLGTGDVVEKAEESEWRKSASDNKQWR
jgi:hypothetical protein